MPARRTTTVHSSDTAPTESHNLTCYYCLKCSKSVIFLSANLACLPRRRTDGAYATEEKDIKKHSLVQGETVDLLRHGQGVEKQHRLCCASCGIDIGYKPVPLEEPNQFLYILPGIVSSNPTLNLSLLRSSALAIPNAIAERTNPGEKPRVSVKIIMTYGSHTTMQVADITPSEVLLQTRLHYQRNDLKVNELLLRFFAALCQKEKHAVQLLAGQQSDEKTIGVEKASCGYVYKRLLEAMFLPEYICPVLSNDAPVPAKKRKMKKREE